MVAHIHLIPVIITLISKIWIQYIKTFAKFSSEERIKDFLVLKAVGVCIYIVPMVILCNNIIRQRLQLTCG
jgi:sorbitol-specific phosphotransferase system component IIC